MDTPQYHPQYFTATILDWQRLLKPDKYKNVIIQSLQFLVKEKRVELNAFVIMSNHIHLIWQIQAGDKKENVQRDFFMKQAKMSLESFHIGWRSTVVGAAHSQNLFEHQQRRERQIRQAG